MAGKMNRPSKVDVFDMLLARLDWPLRPIRLMATRRVAELLNGDQNGLYKKRFFDWFSERQTETEIVNGLVVLGLLDNKLIGEISDITQLIRFPSILADNYLESIYGTRPQIISWSKATCGPTPTWSVSEGRFKDGIGVFAAPIFKTVFIDLEKKHGLPFMEQWSWEWHCLDMQCKRNSPSPRYFSNDSSDQPIRCDVEARESDIFKSSFVRTLHHAVINWDMPLELASEIANMAAPSNLDLARIEPSDIPPNWPYFESDASVDEATSGEALKGIFSKLMSPDATEIVVAANGHLYQSQKRWVEAEYICGLNEGNSLVNPEELQKTLHSWNHAMPELRLPGNLSSKSTHNNGKEINTECRPLAIRLYPKSQFSWPRYHISMITRGLYAPYPNLFGDSIRCFVRGDSLVYETINGPIGRMIYWYAPWSTSHPVDTDGSIGTALLLQKDVVEDLKNKSKGRLLPSFRVNRLFRKDKYEKWQTETATGFVLPFPEAESQRI